LPTCTSGLSPLGYELSYAGSERFRELIAADHNGAVIREAGIAPN
jgi:hypothetical protein